MFNITEINSKKTRTFGWVQDASNLDSLCNVVAIFDSTSDFHKRLKTTIIPALVNPENGRDEMVRALNESHIALNYKLLIGGHATPRSESPCNGIVQAAIKGQKREYIGDWPADNFVRWAQAFGFISYNYDDDSFSITEFGKSLVRSENKNEILIKAVLSYPPAYRILSLLKNPNTILTKFELGEKLGFTGEDGFISYPLASIIAALNSAETQKERSDIRSDWESSSDKYARTICQWLVRLGFLENAEKEVSVQYGNKLVSDTLGGFRITPTGERYLRNASGNSRHKKVAKIVSYEMFATKGKDREYLRFRRSLILKFLSSKKGKCAFDEIGKFIAMYGLNEIAETISDDVNGFINLGLEIRADENGAELKDSICDFPIPHYKDLSEKSELSAEKEIVRAQLKNISHEYLSLMDIAFDSQQNRLFEMKFMELFLHECNFLGNHLGGASRPDGALYADVYEGNYGIIVDTKAYSKGYDLPVGQRDEMLRYIRENHIRDKKQNPNEWWKIFPENLNKFYFMFVSGKFKGDIAGKLEKIAAVHNVSGTAMPIATALLVAEKIKGGRMSMIDFADGIRNTEYEI